MTSKKKLVPGKTRLSADGVDDFTNGKRHCNVIWKLIMLIGNITVGPARERSTKGTIFKDTKKLHPPYKAGPTNL